MENVKEQKEELENRMQNIGGKGFVSHGFQQIIRGAQEDKKQMPSENKKEESAQKSAASSAYTLKESKQQNAEERKIQKEVKKEKPKKQETEIKKEPSAPQEKKTAKQTLKPPPLSEELEIELSIETAVRTLYSKILYQVKQRPLSRKELSAALGQKNISGQLNQVISKLLTHCLIEHTIKAVINHPRQKFKISNRGQEFLELVEYRRSQENQ